MSELAILIGISRLQDHGRKCRGAVLSHRSAIGDELVHLPKLAPYQPEERIAPEHDQHYLKEEPVPAMFLFHMHQFVLEDLLSGGGLEVDLLVPENIVEEGKG